MQFLSHFHRAVRELPRYGLCPAVGKTTLHSFGDMHGSVIYTESPNWVRGADAPDEKSQLRKK